MSRILFSLAFLLLCSFSLRAQDTLTLMDAISIGLENNYSIKIQQNNAEIAANNNTIGNAGLLPRVDLNATNGNTINNTQQEFFVSPPRSATNAKSTSLTAGVMMNWTIFNGFSMFAGKKALEQLEVIGEQQMRLAMEQTTADIIVAYYRIVQIQKSVQVYQDAVNISMQRYKLAQSKISVGSGSQVLLLQAQVDLNQDSSSLVEQYAFLKNAKSDLNLLLARDVTLDFNVQQGLAVNETLTHAGITEQAIQKNRNIIIAAYRKDLLQQQIVQSRSALYPTISVYGGYNYTKTSAQVGLLKSNRSFGPTFGVTGSWNLFNGFVTQQNIQNSKLQAMQGDYAYRQTELEVKNQIYNSYNEYNAAIEIVRIQRKNLEVARQNQAIALERYKVGALNDLDFRIIQQSTITAESNLLMAEFRAKTAEINLTRLSGDMLAK